MAFDLKSYLLGKQDKPFIGAYDLPSWLMGKAQSGDTKTLTGVPPLTFVSDGSNLKNWVIFGNDPGVGEQTAQLYNDATKKTDTSIFWSSGDEMPREGYELSDYIAVGAMETLVASSIVLFAGYDNNKTYLGTYYPDANAWDKNGRGYTSTFPNSVALGAAYVRILTNGVLSNIMLNSGSTVLPYEPYGYKIPVETRERSGNTWNVVHTTNIYTQTQLGTGDTITKEQTGVDIPTVNGSNTLTVETTVQPSSMTITYKKG